MCRCWRSSSSDVTRLEISSGQLQNTEIQKNGEVSPQRSEIDEAAAAAQFSMSELFQNRSISVSLFFIPNYLYFCDTILGTSCSIVRKKFGFY